MMGVSIMVRKAPGRSFRFARATAFVFAVLFHATAFSAPGAESYAFSTAAGQAGSSGFQDGLGGIARFNQPGAIATDAAGNVYVADTANHVIRKLSAAGSGWTATTIAGRPGTSGKADGTNDVARFFFPSGIAAASSGDLFVADTYNHTIRRLTPSGTNWVVRTYSGTAGTPGNFDGIGTGARYNLPNGLITHSSGVYVTDNYNHTLRKLAPMGETCLVTTPVGTAGQAGYFNGTNETVRMNYPSAITVIPSGDLLVADTYNLVIRQVSPLGPDWIASTAAGQVLTPGAADGAGAQAQFNYSFGLTSDAAGSLYIADTYNHTVRKAVYSAGAWSIVTLAGAAGTSGSADGAGNAARFYQPAGICVDTLGRIWVADTFNHTIRVGRPGAVLDIAISGAAVVVSWPSASAGYSLETRTSLAPGAWTTISSGISLQGDRFYYTNSAAGGPRFYRLRK